MDFVVKRVPVSQLVLDQANSRLGEVQPTQEATYLALARLAPDHFVNLTEDIVRRGLDPMNRLAVVTEPGVPNRYKVLEGNRRTLVLKSLRKPRIIEEALTPARKRKFDSLSKTFLSNPITTVTCVIFDSEDDAWTWIETRHTGANNGVGLMEWNSNEKDRFKSRHGAGKKRNMAGQVLDFLDQVSSPEAGLSARISTTLQRLLSTKYVRDVLGVSLESGVLMSHYPAQEVFKGLHRVATDLRTGDIKVTDVYYDSERKDYIDDIEPTDLPDPASRLDEPVPLSSLLSNFPEFRTLNDDDDATPVPTSAPDAGTDDSANDGTEKASGDGTRPRNGGGPADPSGASSSDPSGASSSNGDTSGPTPRTPSARITKQRSATIPKSSALRISTPRIKSIYHELLTLDADEFANSCAVLLRVFIELSVDDYIARENLMTEEVRIKTALAKRLKTVAGHLKSAGKIDSQLEKTVNRITEGQSLFSISTTTMNQFVHNPYVFPRGSEIRVSWDELQPFVQQIWAR